jgi:hypothetical protein
MILHYDILSHGFHKANCSWSMKRNLTWTLWWDFHNKYGHVHTRVEMKTNKAVAHIRLWNRMSIRIVCLPGEDWTHPVGTDLSPSPLPQFSCCLSVCLSVRDPSRTCAHPRVHLSSFFPFFFPTFYSCLPFHLSFLHFSFPPICLSVCPCLQYETVPH